MLSLLFFVGIALSLGFLVVGSWMSIFVSKGIYPPGPRPIPFMGNVHQLPSSEFFKTYVEWANKFGPITYFHVFGKKFIVLNDLKTASDLLEKRSSIYSTRPRLVMVGELLGRSETATVFMKYGQRLKNVRRILNSWVGKNAIPALHPAGASSTYKFLGALLDDPNNFLKHIKFQIGSLTLKLTYGIDCTSYDDDYFKLLEKMNHVTGEACAPGRWLCDSFPFLANLPPWFPMAGFRKWAIEARCAVEEAFRAPFDVAVKAVMNGSSTPSWISNELIDGENSLKKEQLVEEVKISALGVYGGATDTTAAALRTFFLMMARSPDIQRKAQVEIDSHVGRDRLPDMSDKELLPYVNCILKEVIRFACVAPIVAHSLDQDDYYEGYLIPKGTCVMANIWAILRNPSVFRDPDEFCPERFETTAKRPAEPDLTHVAFGFGRRACPGIHLAQASLFLNIAMILSAFEIKPALNEVGEEELPAVDFEDGHIRYPKAFRCRIEPRNAEKIQLIQQAIAASSAD